MHISLPAIIATLSLTSTANAWAQAADGTWVANDVAYLLDYTGGIPGYAPFPGAKIYVHEACTWMNTDRYHPLGDGCAVSKPSTVSTY
jgi:hypothetical protein